MKSSSFLTLSLLTLLSASSVFAGRYYDSKTGRWLSVDPKAYMRPGLSPYNYCQNNPLNRIDPNGLRDIKIEIHRTMESGKSTQGIMFSYVVDSKRGTQSPLGNHLHTLELPWKDNQQSVSRIKPDEYSATREHSKKLGEVLRLEDKNGRSDVLIHQGNTAQDTEGCPLVGKEQGQDQIYNSKEAKKDLMDSIDNVIEEDKANGEKTTISVIVSDDFVKSKKDDENNNTGK